MPRPEASRVITLRPADVFTSLAFKVVVYGDPVPQGSKTGYVLPHSPTIRGGMCRGGRVAMTDQGKDRLDPWRERIMLECRASRDRPDHPIDAPVAVAATFYLSRPKSLPRRIEYPAKRPDLDKLARAALDSLKDAGVLAEDSRVVDLDVYKRFAPDGVPFMALGVFVCPA